jgi:hypothetical protein
MLRIDTQTRAAYNAGATAAAKVNAILVALADPVTVKVLNGNGNVMGSGTMATPWATILDNVLTMTNVTNFEVTTGGIPNSSWVIRFESGDRWLEGSFGLIQSGQEFIWSLPTWEAGQAGRIGDASASTWKGVADNNVASWFSINSIGSTTLEWLSSEPKVIGPFTEGVAATYDFKQDANIPSGTNPRFTITSTPQLGMVLDETTGILTIADTVAGADYPVSVDLSDATPVADKLQDWINRSTGPGVVWAHRFNDDSAMYFGTRYEQSTGVWHYKDNQFTPPPNESYTWRNPNDGIMEDGCLELFCPAGTTPNCVWGRPLAPLIAEQGQGVLSHLSYPKDINNAGLYESSFQQFFSQNVSQHSKLNTFRGANFGNAAYRAEWGDGERIWSEFGLQPSATRWYREHKEWVHSGRFWMQLRMKLSPSKLSRFERASKLMWPMERSMSNTDQAAVVMTTRAGGTTNSPTTQPNGTYKWPTGTNIYRAQGAFDLEADMFPYDQPRRAIHEDFSLGGCNRTSAGTLPDNVDDVCWGYPSDEWFTVMWSFDMGTDTPENKINPRWLTDPTVPNKYIGWDFTTGLPTRDTTVQVYVASPGDTAWTRLVDTTTWWWYGNDIEGLTTQRYGSFWNGAVVPYGFNVMRFTLFNGGSNNYPVFYDQWLRVDQIIFSTQEIPLPVY